MTFHDNAEQPEPIRCQVTQKLLARKDAHGIYLWCKACKAEHYIPLINTAATEPRAFSIEIPGSEHAV